MPFEDRLALLIDREIAERRSRALRRRLKKARLHHEDACFEDIILSRGRGLDRSLILGLGDCDWLRNGANILITGPTGTGKSWIACALAHKACLEGFQAQYRRLPRLLTELRIAHGEGTIPRFYADLARIDLLVLDDWGRGPARRRQAPRHPRDPRRPIRPPLDRPHQPDAGRRMAPPARRPDPRRRHPRPPSPCRLPHRAHRPIHAGRARKAEHAGHEECKGAALRAAKRRSAPKERPETYRPGIGMARAPLRLVRVTRRAPHAPSACGKPRHGLSLCNTAKGGSLNRRSGVATLRVAAARDSAATSPEIGRLLPVRFTGYFPEIRQLVALFISPTTVSASEVFIPSSMNSAFISSNIPSSRTAVLTFAAKATRPGSPRPFVS